MCFSPHASFGAAAILSVLGIAALRRKPYSKLSLIAAIPLFFGMQQALEGVVWISLRKGDHHSWIVLCATYGFLFFAVIWWPLYIPIIIRYIESDKQKKKLLLFPLVAGLCAVGVSFFNLIQSNVYVKIISHHIAYQLDNVLSYSDLLYYFGLTSYLIAIAGALWISTIPHAWIMSILGIIAAVTAHIWYYYAFSSVWCFFGAICSMLIISLF
jgi:hypothetical protein